MPASLRSLDDDVLVVILRKAAATDPPYLGDILLVCKRFRNVALAAATSVHIACNNASLLRHGAVLRTMTLTRCTCLPWEVDEREAGAPSCAPAHLSHLSSVTHIDASRANLLDAELSKLRCLPQLRHLSVSKNVTDEGVAHLAGLTSLVHLDLSQSTRLTPASLTHLSSLVSLTSLDLHDTIVPPDTVPEDPVNLITEFVLNRHARPLITDDALSALAPLTALQSLNLSYVLGANAGLHHLSALQHLQVLDLSHNREVSSAHLPFLAHLTCLDTLNLECSTDDINSGLAHVEGLTRMTQLKFHDMNLLDSGMAHLTRLTALTALDLHDLDNVSILGYLCLRDLLSLRCIKLGATSPVPMMVPHLTGLQLLQEVSVDHMAERTLTCLCELRHLTRLDIQIGATAEELSHLTKLSALQHLVLDQEAALNMNDLLPHVTGLTKLTHLDVHYCNLTGLTDEGLGRLAALRNLHSLWLNYCPQLTDHGLAHVSELSLLTSLRLENCDRIASLTLPESGRTRLRILDLGGCAGITDRSLAILSSVAALADLCLRECVQLTDAGISALGELRTLTSLDLSGCNLITDAGLAQLSRLRALKSVSLCGCVLLEDGAMATLSCLRALTFVDVRGCVQVTDEGLSHLASIPRLQQLCLFMHLPAACLSQVARMSFLRLLDLRGCTVSDAASITKLTSLFRLEHLWVSEYMMEACAPLREMRGLRITS